MLTYLKTIAEKGLGKPVADCVISVSEIKIFELQIEVQQFSYANF